MKPAPDRVWYRSRITGDRGYIYQDGERVRIRLDRPNDDVSRPYVDSEWIEEVEIRNFTPMQMAQIAFVADRQLCTFLGLHADAKLEWLSQKEPRRIRFMNEGPDGPDVRKELFVAMMGVLRKYC